ncbi:amidohydrolase family protein [Tunturiibacter gelidiferens]
MLETGVPVGQAQTPRGSRAITLPSLYWRVTGETIGGLSLFPEKHRFNRTKRSSAYFVWEQLVSTEDGKKGSLAQGQLADLAVLSSDYFSIPEEETKNLESVLTIAGARGKVV